MVDGGFDPIHPGHIDYMAAAAELGSPVLCNVSADRWVAAKHPPLLTQADRVRVIDAIRHVDYVHPSDHTTREVLEELRPRYYVKGADWRERGLPADEVATCERHGIEIVYLDTVTNSSTQIVERFLAESGEG
jgi:cytidyltransferase-like protein